MVWMPPPSPSPSLSTSKVGALQTLCLLDPALVAPHLDLVTKQLAGPDPEARVVVPLVLKVLCKQTLWTHQLRYHLPLLLHALQTLLDAEPPAGAKPPGEVPLVLRGLQALPPSALAPHADTLLTLAKRLLEVTPPGAGLGVDLAHLFAQLPREALARHAGVLVQTMGRLDSHADRRDVLALLSGLPGDTVTGLGPELLRGWLAVAVKDAEMEADQGSDEEECSSCEVYEDEDGSDYDDYHGY